MIVYPMNPAPVVPVYTPPPAAPYVQRTVKVAGLFGDQTEWITLNLMNDGTVRWISAEVAE